MPAFSNPCRLLAALPALLLALPGPAVGEPVGPTVERKTHSEVIHASAHEYRLFLGGTLDSENTLTRSHRGFAIAFQPNLALTIANTGDRPVAWPRLVANGQGDWSTLGRLVADFTRGARTDQEKALFIWQAAREHRYHDLPLFSDAELHDPVKLFNSYGLNLCDDMGYCGATLFRAAGLGIPRYRRDPKLRCLNGHLQSEAVIDDAYQFLDIDQSAFYLDRENDHPVSGDECARDHDLVRRELVFGPVFGGWEPSEANAALFGSDDTEVRGLVQGHTMQYLLRPQEQVVLRWGNVGKWACGGRELDHRPPFFGNSQFSYRPRLSPEHYREAASEAVDILPATAPGCQLAGGSTAARLVIPIRTPWAICGGTIRAEFVGLTRDDRFGLDVALDGRASTLVWAGQGPGPVTAEVSLDSALATHRAPAKYAYSVIVTLGSGDRRAGANLQSLAIVTDVMTAPLSLPRLRRGENRLVYTDQEAGPHEVTVTHEWQECSELPPPPAPAAPIGPAPGATVRATLVAFRWPAVPGCGTYHLQVSRRADFRVPYRPATDVILAATEWGLPFSGMFAPDTLYYWRVRARDGRGVWSEWSPPWTFRWEGPRVPLCVRSEGAAEGLVLRWEPNPRGSRPVSYDVYGSDEKGFAVHREPYEAYRRGRVAANFLARTTTPSLLVVSAQPTHANMNRCYYRVVAVDEYGTESICSDYAELPHPYFWTRPPAQARDGERFSYRPGVITSLGDVQWRDETSGDGLWDREQNTFSLTEGPAWLHLDPATGELSGIPPLPGSTHIAFAVANQFGRQATQEFELQVR